MDNKDNRLILNGLTIASYTICYKLADTIRTDDLTQIKSKNHVSAKRFTSLDLQRNLIFVDMVFPNIIADMALMSFLGQVGKLSDYISTPKSFTITNENSDQLFYNQIIRKFVKLLLFSDIQDQNLSSGTIFTDRLYYYATLSGVSDLFDWNNHEKLVEFLLPKIRLVTNVSDCWIDNDEFFIKLEFKIDK